MAVAGCGNKCIKFLLFFFNLLFFLGGLLLVGLCAWALIDDDTSTVLEDMAALMGTNHYKTMLYVVLGVSIFIVILSFLGCCGAWKEIRICLILFFIIVLILAIALLLGGIFLIVYKQEIEDEAHEKLWSTLKNEYGEEGENQQSVTRAWDHLQENLKCCGLNSKDSDSDSWYIWQQSVWYSKVKQGERKDRVYVPDSCCVRNDDGIANKTVCTGNDGVAKRPPAGSPEDENLEPNPALHSDGCYEVVVSHIKSKAIIIGAIAIITALIMILAMVFAICLCRAIVA